MKLGIKQITRQITGLRYNGSPLHDWLLDNIYSLFFILSFIALLVFLYISVTGRSIVEWDIGVADKVVAWTMLFTIFTAFLTFLYTQYKHKKDGDVKEMPVVQPCPLGSYFLTNEESVYQISDNGTEMMVRFMDEMIKLILVEDDDIQNMTKWVFDTFGLWNTKTSAPFFVLHNVGRGTAVPKNIWLFHERRKDGCKEPFILRNGGAIQEEIDDVAFFHPLHLTKINNGLLVYNKSTYRQLFEAVNRREVKSFLLIIEYINASNGRKYIQPFVGQIFYGKKLTRIDINKKEYEENGDSKPYLSGFYPLAPSMLDKYCVAVDNYGEILLDKMRKYAFYKS